MGRFHGRCVVRLKRGPANALLPIQPPVHDAVLAEAAVYATLRRRAPPTQAIAVSQSAPTEPGAPAAVLALSHPVGANDELAPTVRARNN